MARPNSTPYAGVAVVDDLDREIIRARLKHFLASVIDARGPKSVARDLAGMGWPYEEGTVRTWRGKKNPPPDVVLALSARYGVSIDEFVVGKALERTLGDQLAEHARRLAALEDKLGALAMLTGHDQDIEHVVEVTDGAREALERSLDDLDARRRQPRDA